MDELLVIGLAARSATINDGGTAADVIFLGAESRHFGFGTPPPITSVTFNGLDISRNSLLEPLMMMWWNCPRRSISMLLR